ncbi:uncharacterized protein METZ01_LOCUS496739, partial [marine metagenome]
FAKRDQKNLWPPIQTPEIRIYLIQGLRKTMAKPEKAIEEELVRLVEKRITALFSGGKESLRR